MAKSMKSLKGNTGGNVAMIFGLLIFPMFAVVGFAIDFNRTVTAKTHIQAALDSASLAAARALEFATNTDDVVEGLALNMFHQDMTTSVGTLECPDPEIVINRVQAEVTLTVGCELPTTLSGLLAVDKVDIQAVSAAKASLTILDLALMLDVSGSMGNGGKLNELKAAAKTAAALLITPETAARVRIGFNTYSTSLNAGIYGPDVMNGFDEEDITWLDLDGDGVDETAKACVSEREGIHAYSDKAPQFGRWIGDKATNCPNSSVLPLTSNLETFNTAIDSLQAGGWTAGHLGIAWAWYLISPDWSSVWPAESAPKQYTEPHVVKSVILMTDGMFNRHYASGQGNSEDQAIDLCDKMRANGVIVYAVAFQAPKDAADLLKDCAGADDRFFDAANGTELAQAYSAIASQLSNLSIVR